MQLNFFLSYKKVFKYLNKYKLYLICLIFLSLILLIFKLITPYLFGNIIDNVNSQNVLLLKKRIIVLIIASLIQIFLYLMTNFLKFRIKNKIIYDLKSKIIISYFNKSLVDFYNMKTGDFFEKLEKDTYLFSNILIEEFYNFFIDLITIILTGIIIFRINLYLSLIIVIIFPISLIISIFLGKSIKNIILKYKKEIDSYLNKIQESMSGFRTIKQFSIENDYIKEINNKIKKALYFDLKSNKISVYIATISKFLSLLSNILIIIIGVNFILKGKLSLGELVAFNSYSAIFSVRILKLSNINARYQNALVSIERVLNLINNFDFSKNTLKSDYEIKKIIKNIKINKINFSFLDKIILKNETLIFEKEKFNIITGDNGSGKTTLSYILSGLYLNYIGDIYIDKININKISRNNHVDLFSYISSNELIMDDSIYENLIMKKKGIQIKKIIEICEEINFLDFIESLSEGIYTRIGKNGLQLSQGQKQKLFIIRGILKNSEVYIFDEVTKNLDKKSKKIFINYLKKIQKYKILIFIEHDLEIFKNEKIKLFKLKS